MKIWKMHKLTVTDSECDHPPDGAWSWRTIQFDQENTRKVFSFWRKIGAIHSKPQKE